MQRACILVAGTVCTSINTTTLRSILRPFISCSSYHQKGSSAATFWLQPAYAAVAAPVSHQPADPISNAVCRIGRGKLVQVKPSPTRPHGRRPHRPRLSTVIDYVNSLIFSSILPLMTCPCRAVLSRVTRCNLSILFATSYSYTVIAIYEADGSIIHQRETDVSLSPSHAYQVDPQRPRWKVDLNQWGCMYDCP